MRKTILLKLVSIFIVIGIMLSPTYALTLEGGVTYTEETARVAAFDGVYKYLTFPTRESYLRSIYVSNIDYNKVLRVIDYKASFALVPMKIIGVIYKDEPNKLYGYVKRPNGYKCFCVQVTEGESYPKRTCNYYTQSGELMSVGIITETQEFKYDKNGKLLGYWENGILKNKSKLPVKMKQLSVLDYSP